MNIKSIGRKLICYISIISLLICGLPFINSDFRSFKNINEADFVFAGEILDKAEYNPIDKNLSFEMKLDVSQRISVEAKINDNPLDKIQPIGVSDYQLTKVIPDNLRSDLPTVEEVEEEINRLIGED